MQYLVICPSMKYFMMALPNHFSEKQIDKFNVNNLELLLSNGDSYKYLSGVKALRGKHGVKVIQWGPLPSWALNHPTLDAEIKLAEHK